MSVIMKIKNISNSCSNLDLVEQTHIYFYINENKK